MKYEDPLQAEKPSFLNKSYVVKPQVLNKEPVIPLLDDYINNKKFTFPFEDPSLIGINQESVTQYLQKPDTEDSKAWTPINWDKGRLEEVDSTLLTTYVRGINREIRRSLIDQSPGIKLNEETLSLLSHFVGRSIASSTQVLGVEGFHTLQVKVKPSTNSYGSYNVNGIIYLSTDLVHDTYQSIASMLGHSDTSSGLTQPLGLLRHVLAHELYHHKQHTQNKKYYYQTVNANFLAATNFFHYYDFDQGEMAAEAFASRTLLEESKNEWFDSDPILHPITNNIYSSFQNRYHHCLFNIIKRSERKKHYNATKVYDPTAGIDRARLRFYSIMNTRGIPIDPEIQTMLTTLPSLPAQQHNTPLHLSELQSVKLAS